MSRAFTLIELLVVVAIIGILISLAFPVINQVRESAKKAAAKADMTSIANAVDEYYSTYSKLPIHSDNFPVESSSEPYDENQELKDIFEILQGGNPREQIFLRQQEGSARGLYLTPWSQGTDLDEEGTQQYELIFDHDLNGEIYVEAISDSIQDYLVRDKRVVVRCAGPNREIEDEITDPDFDDIYSIDIDMIQKHY